MSPVQLCLHLVAESDKEVGVPVLRMSPAIGLEQVDQGVRTIRNEVCQTELHVRRPVIRVCPDGSTQEIDSVVQVQILVLGVESGLPGQIGVVRYSQWIFTDDVGEGGHLPGPYDEAARPVESPHVIGVDPEDATCLGIRARTLQTIPLELCERGEVVRMLSLPQDRLLQPRHCALPGLG